VDVPTLSAFIIQSSKIVKQGRSLPQPHLFNLKPPFGFQLLLITKKTREIATMDNISNSLGFGGSPSDPKAAVMNQVRQEAALQNARQLIEVGLNRY
jgi:hypothetical protein